MTRQTKFCAPTLRRAPAEAEAQNAIWLTRGGYIRAADRDFSLLPLAELIHQRLQHHWQSVLEKHGALPWQNARAAALAASDLHSWRQLPRIFWQALPLEAAASHPGAGLLGSQAIPALQIDLLQGDDDASQLETLWQDLQKAHTWPSLQTIITPQGHSACFLHPLGEQTVLTCPACGYSADARAARRAPDDPPKEAPRPLQSVHTPGCHTIAELCQFLAIPPQRTAKAVFMTARIQNKEQVVFAIVRGDMSLNEDKLRRALQAESLRPATPAEIRALGAEPGYASPVGLPNALTLVDEHIPRSPNLVAGANQADTHLQNVNYGRDFQAAQVIDLVQVAPGDPCPHCGAPLREEKAFELASWQPPHALQAQYSDAQGQPRPLWHSSLKLYPARIIGALAEAFHDTNGLCWPADLAPFDVHLVYLPGRKMDTRPAAEKAYAALQAAGFRVLFDDRDERPGVKFKDADLLGLPIRVTIGERALQAEAVEVKYRTREERLRLPIAAFVTELTKERP